MLGRLSHTRLLREAAEMAPESAAVKVLAQREAENEKHDQQLASLRAQRLTAAVDLDHRELGPGAGGNGDGLRYGYWRLAYHQNYRWQDLQA